MSLSKLPDIPRVFAEWGTDQVLQWLGTLQLSRDYTKQFRDHNIDGPALLRLNPSSLSSLGITDRLDRVKLLQQITTMQADLASLSVPVRRWRGSGKLRRFSENSPMYRTLGTPTRKISMDDSKSKLTLGMSRGHNRPSILHAYPHEWKRSGARSVQSLSGTSSSNSGTLYSVIDASSSVIGTSHSDVTVPRSGAHMLNRTSHSDLGPSRSRSAEGRRGEVGKPQLRRKTSNPRHKEKRLSRSMDKLWEAQLAGNPLPLMTNDTNVSVHGTSRYHTAGAQFQDNLVPQDSIAVRLYDSPSHHATAPVQFHDTMSYHDGGEVQMHENARLVEILREENTTLKRELEIYYQRVCKLMRLEQELERVREAHRLLEKSSERRDRLQAAMRTKLEAELARVKHNSDSGQVLRRRESVMKQRPQMVDKATMVDMIDLFPVHDTQNRTETDLDPEVYSQRIDQLRDHLQSLQQISLRRDELEKQVRNQLQSEIQELQGKEGVREGSTESGGGREEMEGEGVERREGEGTQGLRSGRSSWETEVAVLQADLAKWEQKCTELAAEKELAVEVAVVHKETHINQLKQALTEREGEVTELTQQSQTCQGQLAEAQKHITHLQTSLSLLKSSDAAVLQEKSPSHQAHSSPSHQLHSSPPHQIKHHQLHSSPPHQIHASPPHQVHLSPTHSTYSSPSHQTHPSPSHPTHSSHAQQAHTSPSHRLHRSPPHQLHSSPTKSSSYQHNKPQPTSGSTLELSSRSSNSPSSSLTSDPQSHSHSQLHRDQPPFLTNGGEDPPINTSLYTPAGPLVAPKHMLTDHREGSSPLPSFTDNTSPTTAPAMKYIPLVLSSSTGLQSVKSKTPPPRSEVRILPKNQRSSPGRGSPTSHTPSDLQLFNTLLGEGVPGEHGHHDSGNRVNNLGSKGVNSLFGRPHGNRV